MRTVSFNVFPFSELDPFAQNKAIEFMTGRIGDNQSECDSDDYAGCLKEIERVFDILIKDYNVGYPGTTFRWVWSTSRWTDVDENTDPRYVLRYANDVSRYLKTRRFYSTAGKYVDGKYTYKHRYSKVLCNDYYTLTGTWCDRAVDEAMAKVYDKARTGRCSIVDFIDDMLRAFFNYWEADFEHAYSKEFVREELSERDELEFLADGRPYN